jgi:hypothetical protein
MAIAAGDRNRLPDRDGPARPQARRIVAPAPRSPPPRGDLSNFNLIGRKKLDNARNEQFRMYRSSPHRDITDDLLATAVRIKRDAGVGHGDIQTVIDRFACQELWQERTGGIGFPLVEDIPQGARGEFLAMLSDLVPHVDRLVARMPARGVSVKEIWPSRIE